MAKTKSVPRHNVGDKVRVCSGVSDPDYDDLTIGGWAGTIAEVQSGTPPTWLGECDLELDEGGPVEIEQPTNIVTRPLSMDDQDDRIKAVFGLTRDDPLPDVNFESPLAYHEYPRCELVVSV